MKRSKLFTIMLVSICLVTLGLSMSVAPVWAQSDEPAEEAGGDVQMGTDPRDFAPKFMPYYRFTRLEDRLEQHDLVLFGMFALSKRFAMTYEFPLAQLRDITDTDFFKAGLPRGPGGGVVTPGGVPAEGDGQEMGVGDGNIRLMYRHGQALGVDWLSGMQFDFPTASKDLLGSQQFRLGPMFAIVYDMTFYPAPGAFIAGMNFYFFDAYGEDTAESVSQYVGRWFFMFPLTPPEMGVLGGLYLLPEMQPIYDFKNDNFSFWFAPEFGKMLTPGNIVYAKPGWGIDPSLGSDRDFTFEFGWRWFF